MITIAFNRLNKPARAYNGFAMLIRKLCFNMLDFLILFPWPCIIQTEWLEDPVVYNIRISCMVLIIYEVHTESADVLSVSSFLVETTNKVIM